MTNGTPDMTDEDDRDVIENAEDIIERFGGIRPMARKMSVAFTTVQGWKKRKTIPGNHRADLLAAARANDIDLSDLTDGAANQNGTASTASVPTSKETSPPMDHDSSSFAGPRPDASSSPAEEGVAARWRANADMLEHIRKAQDVTFTKSALFTVLFVAGVIGISGFLLWPAKNGVHETDTRVAQLEEDIDAVKEQHAFLKKLVPADLAARVADMQEQAQDIQGAVNDLAVQVGAIADGTAALSGQTLETRLRALETGIAGLAGPGALTALLDKVAALQGSAIGRGRLDDAVAALNRTLGGGGDLEIARETDPALGQVLDGVPAEDVKAAALLLALAQFRDSLNRSAPFTEDLALLQSLLGDSDTDLQAALIRLAPQAEKGVLTPAGLKKEFSGLAGEIVVSSLKGEDVSVREKALARLNGVLQVEKDGALLTGTDTQAVVARARQKLDAGDIQGAVVELQSLDGAAAETAAPWMDEAQMTLMARQALSLIGGRATDMVGNGPGVDRLLREIGRLATLRHVYSDPESGVTVLSPKPALP